MASSARRVEQRPTCAPCNLHPRGTDAKRHATPRADANHPLSDPGSRTGSYRLHGENFRALLSRGPDVQLMLASSACRTSRPRAVIFQPTYTSEPPVSTSVSVGGSP